MKTIIALHHTAGVGNSQYESVKSHHSTKFDVSFTAYHVFIEADGQIYWHPAGLAAYLPHVGEWNWEAIGICLAGHFGKHSPTAAQIVAMHDVISEAVAQYPIERIANHGELRNTDCPVIDLVQLYEIERDSRHVVTEASILMRIRSIRRGIARSRGRVHRMLERTLKRLTERKAKRDVADMTE